MRRAAAAAAAALAALTLGVAAPVSGGDPPAHAEPPPGREPGTSHQPCGAWGSYGRVPARTFDYDCPSAISPTTARSLAPLWAFKTDKTVTASPVVVDGRLFVGDWSATMYALDADTGAELWRFRAHEAPGAPFGPIVATAAVADAGGRTLVVFGSGPTMHAVDAATGDEVWRTYVGSAETPEQHPDDEQTEFESSPLVAGGIVYSGLDVHNRTVEENHGVRGGVFAFDLASGEILGFFDVEHDHLDDVTGERLSGCSSVWSSPTLDTATDTLYFATGNCPHDLPEGSDWGQHVEAVSAVDADPRTWSRPERAVRWTFTPEPLNRDDTDFGATPNLFLDAAGRRLLGVGKKDAVYYALDPATGELIWSTQVTEPGNVGEDFAVGGFIGSTATGRGGVFGGTAIAFTTPYFHALEARDGSRRWSGVAGPSYAASGHVNGVVIAGALDNELKAWDARTGDLLVAHPLAGPISSGPAVVGDRVYVGSGTSSSDLCAKDTPGAEACLAAFDEALGRTGGVHAFTLAAPGHQAAGPGAAGSGILLANEGHRSWAHDVASLERRVLVRSVDDAAGAADEGSGAGGFRDVHGQVCADPTRHGHHVTGEGAGGAGRPPGWGYFRVTGATLEALAAEQVGALRPRHLEAPGPAGCGFLADGRLVTTTVGEPLPGQPATGRLLVWFPPLDRGDVPHCTVDSALAAAGGVHVDEHDRVYIAVGRPDDAGNPAGVLRYSGDLPRSVDECTATDAAGAPAVADGSVTRELFITGGATAPTPSSVAASGRGTFYVSSTTSGTIAEYDGEGAFVRFVLAPAGVPGVSTGTPVGLAVGDDGTVYYADAGVVGGEPVPGNGTVRRIRFDADGRPLAPETLNAGLDDPDGLGLVLRPATSGPPAGPPVEGAPAPAPAPPPGGTLPRTGARVAGPALLLLALAVLARLVRRSGPA